MPGFNTITGDESIMFADNASFDGTQRGGKMITNGQLWIGATASPHVKLGSLTSPLGTITIGYSSPNITLDLAGGSSAIDSVAVDASTAPGSNPVVPTGDGLITVTGGQVASGVVGTHVIRTDSLAANTYTIEIQRSTAIGVSTVADNGVSHFNSGQFTVDANGFVSIIGGTASTNFTVDASTAPGTNPVLPNGSGNVIVTGAQVAAGVVGTNVIRTDSVAASEFTIEIQRSQAVASTTIADNGVCHFNSAQFTVDANGFVAINGTGVGETITGQSGGALSPTAGNWNIFGASTAAGTSPVVTSGAVSTLTVNVQKSQAIAATDATKVGLSVFNSGQFSVDANGFVSLAGGGQAIDSVQVDAATAPGTNPVIPTAAGLIIVTGGQVAAGTVGANVIRTDSLAANTYTVEIQRSTTNATTDSTKNGVSHFNSTQFTVDSNGFVSSLGVGFVWIDQATSITLAVNTGYFVTAATTQTLPASPVQGTVVKIVADTSGAVVVTANTGQKIRLGNLISSTAGTMTSTLQGDCMELVYRSSSSTWISIANNGVWQAA